MYCRFPFTLETGYHLQIRSDKSLEKPTALVARQEVKEANAKRISLRHGKIDKGGVPLSCFGGKTVWQSPLHLP